MLHCAGRIVVGERLSVLHEVVLHELDKRSIVLDLSQVDRVDAGGLGLLVFLYTCTNEFGTELKLLVPSVQVAKVFELTKLNSVFTVFPAAETGSELPYLFPDGRCEACA
jgi:anti-anti-sigma factor